MRCIGPHAHWLLVVSVLAFCNLVSGGFLNRTIDDVHGDSSTGALVQYLPEVPASEGPLWFNQTSCAGCADVPDAKFALQNTWTAALYLADIGSMSVTMKFSGTAIYVFFIIPNFAADSGLASVVRCDFFIDGADVGTFTHDSDGSSQFSYNTLVYQNTTIPDGDHVLLIETTGADPAIIIFDYVLYTVNTPDPSETSTPTSFPSSSSSPPSVTTQTPIVVDIPASGTSTTTESPAPPTQTQPLPAFPTGPNPSQSAIFVTSALPFLITPLSSDASPPFSTNPPSLAPAPLPDTAASQRSENVVAIAAGVAGGVILVVFALLSLLLCRRRRRQLRARQGSGTVSVFDLLNDSPSPQPPSQPPMRRRPLPAPPQHPGGRSIDATPSKADAAPSFAERVGHSHSHSAQSSMSSYSDNARSDLHIHIPMASFRHRDAERAPSPLSLPPSNTHSRSHSHSHTHSPITRNGVPIPPEQEELVRALLLGPRAHAGDTDSLRRGSASSAEFTPTTTTSMAEEDGWGPPVIHVDSGIRISRAMMELPPVYAAS